MMGTGTETQVRDLEARVELVTVEESLVLDFSSWLTQLAFLYNPGWVPLTVCGTLHHLSLNSQMPHRLAYMKSNGSIFSGEVPLSR